VGGAVLSGEHAEAVLRWQVLAAVLARASGAEGTRLASELRQRLINGDAEAALCELLSGSKPTDASSEDGDRRQGVGGTRVKRRRSPCKCGQEGDSAQNDESRVTDNKHLKPRLSYK
jgi:hypothetical protein